MDDKQTSGNSLKVTVRGNSCGDCSTSATEEQIPKELYKPISEDLFLPPLKETGVNNIQESNNHIQNNDFIEVPTTQEQNGNSRMVQEGNAVNDGADEQMLGTDDEKLERKPDEIKFIKGDHQNGDAKLDIGMINGKTFTGMTKEELMKYANDPFWVRLRWIFFIGFWAIWLAMLIGAILIIIEAPKCAAPKPLPWFKEGPLAKLGSIDGIASTDLELVKTIHATGVIYELPAESTYSVKEPSVQKKIVELVAKYKDTDVNIILDITPNYVNKQSHLMQQALEDKNKRSAFIWMEQSEVPNNWLSIVNGTAWSEVLPGNYVLSQFGDDLYDLDMNDTIVKAELKQVFSHLLSLGVKGFRLKNTKFYLLTKNIADEVPSDDPRFIHTQYGFWTHTQTTFQEGLGDVLYEYQAMVKNISTDALFSVSDDIIRPEVYRTKDGISAIELPLYGRFTQSLNMPLGKNLHAELRNTFSAVGNSTWLQWNFGDLTADSPVNASASELFMSLLPGVPVVPVETIGFNEKSSETFKHINEFRSAPSFKYGDFEMYPTTNGLIAYSRIKAGNPGYFVAFNPTNATIKGEYINQNLPDKMTVDVISDNYNITDVFVKSKVMTNSIPVSAYSTIILTYVPITSG